MRLHTVGRRTRLCGTVLAAVLAAMHAAAGTITVEALLDLDTNPATGCAVVTGDGTFEGADAVLASVIDTDVSPPLVVSVSARVCTGVSFGPPTPVAAPYAPPWPLGVGTGPAGANVLETYYPLATGITRIGITSSSLAGAADALLQPVAAQGEPVPALSATGIAVLIVAVALIATFALAARGRGLAVMVTLLVLGVAALAWAAFTLDGEVDDWAAAGGAADAAGDAPDEVDILAAFARMDSGVLLLRVDLAANHPPVAAADAFAVGHDANASGNLLAPNPSVGDTDWDGDSLHVEAVDGAAGNVGVPHTLASGARLTVQADGTFLYETNGAFAALCAGQTHSDGFSYTVADEHDYCDGAAVTITVSGSTGVGAVALEYRINGDAADTPPGVTPVAGASLALSYVVTNTGTEPLSSLEVTDAALGAVACPDTALAPGASMTCTTTTTAVAGPQSLTASVSGTARCAGAVAASDPAYYTGLQPGIELVKATNGVDADTPPGPTVLVGSTVAWTYAVTNTGDATLTAVSVTDDQGVVVSCPKTTLAPAEAMTCTGSGTAVAGQYANIGTATGTPPVGPAVTASDPSHYFGIAPAIAIEKRVNGNDADTPPGPTVLVGSTVAWTYAVTNTGNATLTAVSVTDDQGVTVSCPKTTLAPAEAMTCTGSGTAVSGQYVNVGTATGTPPVGPAVVASDLAHYFGIAPAIGIEKLVNGNDADTPPGPTVLVGSTVAWTYAVTNTGNATLTAVSVTDDQGVTVSCPKTTLAPAEAMTCTGSGTAVAGQYANIGTATGTPPVGPAVTASDPSHYFGIAPAIAIEKRVNGEDADTPPGPTVLVGSPVTWSYAVTNTGDATLTAVSVTDDRGVAVTCPKTTLAPAEAMTCTGSGTAVAGQYANIGTATGTPPVGPAVVASDPSHYLGIAPAIGIEKFVNGVDADTPPGPTVLVGSTVTWSYVVTNTGNATLTWVSVTDDQGVAVTCPKTTLAPAETMTCTGSGTAVLGQYANIGTATGTATGTPPVGTVVVASDPAHYLGLAPAIGIEKLVNGVDADTAPGPSLLVGTMVVWTYVVTNTGDATLTSVSVTDDQGVTVSCPKTTLAPAEAMTCTASGTAVSGQYVNVGMATGTPPVDPDVVASDLAHYTGILSFQGCVPGYWRNHTDSWPPTGYATNQRIDTVFAASTRFPALASATLYNALSFGGGSGDQGAAEIVLRAGVAAVLNAAHPGVAYPRTEAAVIADVNTALAGTRDQMLAMGAVLDADNNRGCPLN